ESSEALKRIKVLENRISFVLKHGTKEEARKLNQELLQLDPSNRKFEEELVLQVKSEYDINAAQEYWTDAWKTLAEIESLAGARDQINKEESVSWDKVARDELSENYREYAYALILANEEENCLSFLDEMLEIRGEDFKDISYLK